MSKKKNLRAQVTSNMLRNLFGSALAKSIVVLALSVVYSIVKSVYWPLVAPLVMVILYRHSLVFEILLMVHIIESSLGSWNYFSRIDQYILLGGIPMKSMDHISVLSLDHKVEAVLSVNEDYELYAITLAGSPVSPEEWKKEDIHHQCLTSVDFAPPPPSVLEEGADWIKRHVDLKKVVYVHCKSGIGRSVSVVAAYFMKHQRMSAINAVELIRSKRIEIFKPGSKQMTNLIEYEKIIFSEQKFSIQP